ncbi:uncharacterized protein LOC129570345 [Sitodiplosis mosellana]|uniref:uncharacterized protein LOC129570345 n=1 Tax=Sitodiplosis mosellana TaxID=263140 RepID=UPI00244523F3|nr:uncharacterized protein LOC129570345 [Sitodiplosis mosellana]
MVNKRKRRCQTPKRNNRAKRQRLANDNEVVCATQIVDVNNDCLEHVFNHLSLMDLINVASANKQLGPAAATVFARKHGKKMVEILACDFSSKFSETEAVEVTNDAILISKPAVAFRILRLFGDVIFNITMRGKWPFHVERLNEQQIPLGKHTLAYINEYCSDSLKSLALDSVVFMFADAKKPYKNVEELSIEHGTIGFEASQFNDTFPKMHRLNLNFNAFSDHKHFAGRLEQLEHLKIGFFGLCDGLTRTDVRKIICLNPQLQSLSLMGDFNLKFWDYASKQLKQLIALELYFDQDGSQKYPVKPIRFECVETLKLNIAPSENKWKPEKVLVFKQLKHCRLTGRLNDSWIDFAVGSPSIEKLEIVMKFPHSFFFTEHQMAQLAANLPNLTELSMTRCSCSVKAAIRFWNESQTVRKFTLTVFDKDDLDELYSKITSDWNATKMRELIVIERKE